MMGFVSRKPLTTGLSAAAITFALDQGIKTYLLTTLGFAHRGPGDAITLGPFLNLVMVWNKGVSFGLFPADSMAGRVFLLTFASGVVGGLTYWLTRTRDALSVIGIGLVIGGALGNMLDRLRFGAVADFFHLHAFGYNWYVFNVADAAIVAGVGLLLYESLLGQGQHGSTSKGPRGPSNEG